MPVPSSREERQKSVRFMCRLDSLCSVWFIGALALLLLNDLYLKPSFHNWVTGKLSDFAGLYVFAVASLVVVSKRRWLILGLIAITFIFWKSAYSQPLIELWNAGTSFRVDRVVDPFDLLALSIIPLAALQSSTCLSTLRGVLPIVLVIITLFAVMGTTKAAPVRQQAIAKPARVYLLGHSPELVVGALEKVTGRVYRKIPFDGSDLPAYERRTPIQFTRTDVQREPKLTAVISVASGTEGDEETRLFLYEVIDFGEGKGSDDLVSLFESGVIEKIKNELASPR